MSRYLAKLFAVEALSFFLVAAFLVWITQTLRLFDLVTAKGQDMLTLLGQSVLTTPPLALAIIYICMGTGMARAMRAIQESRELHSIHSSGRVRAQWGAVVLFILGGVIAVSMVAHWLEPWSKRSYADWSSEVAADLVGRALNPHRFSEVVPGLVIVIGGRKSDGTIIDFFADDKRDPSARSTYIADEAVISFDEEGYNIRLSDGAVQYIRDEKTFTEVAFSRYEIALDRVVGGANINHELDQKNTFTLLNEVTDNPQIADAVWSTISQRLAEATRVIGICLVVASLTFFPHARRGRNLFPIEVVVLILGLIDRAVSSLTASNGLLGHHLGAFILIGLAALIFMQQLLGPLVLNIFRRAA